MVKYRENGLPDSLPQFYREGPSLYGYIKGNNTDPFKEESHFVTAKPQIRERIYYLIKNDRRLPALLLNMSLRLKAKLKKIYPFKKDIEYPGDGFIFFIDIYLMTNNQQNLGIFESETAIKFYNYLYSYRHLLSYATFRYFTSLSSKKMIKFLYEYRSQIFKDKSIFKILRKACKERILKQDEFESCLANRLFRKEIPSYIKIDPCLLTLLNNFTLKTVERLIFDYNENYKNAYDLVIETMSLLQVTVLERKFTSYNALKKYHDEMSEKLLRIKNPGLFDEYVFPEDLVAMIDSVTNGVWRFPVKGIELHERGRQHKNCVGAYVTRHFLRLVREQNNKIVKTLILFSENAEAEVRLYFKKKEEKYICNEVNIIQVKTLYNAPFQADELENLKVYFIGCEASMLIPKKKEDVT